jgi:uncharacterized protein (TIGR02118 family)
VEEEWKSDQMIRVLVLYPREGGTRFDHEYYATKHLDLVKEVMGDTLKSIEFAKGISDPDGNPPAFVAMASMLFDSKEAHLEKRAACRARIAADIPKFTDCRPITQIGEISVSEV